VRDGNEELDTMKLVFDLNYIFKKKEEECINQSIKKVLFIVYISKIS
jgi:hypothetical protein